MDFQAKTRTEQILTVMYIVSWVAFVGFAIIAGAVLFSFGASLINPEAAKDLYQGLNLSELRQTSLWQYCLSLALIFNINALKAMVWYEVTQTLSQIKMVSPFTRDVVKQLEKISVFLLITWLAGLILSIMAHYADFYVDNKLSASGEFIFMAGLVYIISQIFKRGLEIQAENELTI